MISCQFPVRHRIFQFEIVRTEMIAKHVDLVRQSCIVSAFATTNYPDKIFQGVRLYTYSRIAGCSTPLRPVLHADNTGKRKIILRVLDADIKTDPFGEGLFCPVYFGRLDVAGVRTDADVELSGFPDVLQFAVVEFQVGSCDAERYALRFAGFQRDPAEVFQFPDRSRDAGHRIADVELDDFVARAGAGVGYFDRV